MKNIQKIKNGFTLIELLAVIVILAIIALIAVPLISNVIKAAKEKSFIVSVYGILDTAELKMSLNDLDMTDDPIELASLEYKGKRFEKGSIVIDDDLNISIAIWDEELNLCAVKGFDDEEVIIDRTKTEDTCGDSGLNITSADDSYVCFDFNSGTKTIESLFTGGCPVSTLFIPSKIDGIEVEHLGSYLMSDDYNNLSQVIDFTYATKLLSVGDNAFYGYYIKVGVENLDGAINLATIGDYGFADASTAEILTLPNSLVSIGNSAFSHNRYSAFSHERISVLTLSDNLTTIGNAAFSDNEIASVVIPNSVTSIGDQAFSENLITNVEIQGKSSFDDFNYSGTSIFDWETGYSDADIVWN